MKNNKGFTLVELLAVIVILAIILVIAVPKVMDVINDSKKATLESTAKMIASAAEKAKVQNTVLGKTEEITCDSVAKINDLDYEDCKVDFEDNTAKVTIKGSGKFAGLHVCSGTKIDAVASEEECLSNNNNTGASYITSLLVEEETKHNGLIQTYATVNGEQVDAGIRYTGSLTGEGTVKNKVYYNCDDTDSSGVAYGEDGYNYASSCEVWRIIGVFNTYEDETDTTGALRMKIVRDEYPIKASWDSSASDTNHGYGINQWGESTYGNGTIYAGADIMRMLNTYYLGTTNTCTYCNGIKQEECNNDCSNDITPLSNTAKNFIDNAVWHTSITSNRELLWVEERGNNTDRFCVTDVYCTDTVARTTQWVGKVGLIYASDFGYACNGIDNWLNPTTEGYWTMSIWEGGDNPPGVWVISDNYSYKSPTTYDYTENVGLGIRPSVYLKSGIKIISGNGDTEPYKLAL